MYQVSRSSSRRIGQAPEKGVQFTAPRCHMMRLAAAPLLTQPLALAGMKCGGCVGHVKKLLEDQPDVTTVGG